MGSSSVNEKGTLLAQIVWGVWFFSRFAFLGGWRQQTLRRSALSPGGFGGPYGFSRSLAAGGGACCFLFET